MEKSHTPNPLISLYNRFALVRWLHDGYQAWVRSWSNRAGSSWLERHGLKLAMLIALLSIFILTILEL